MKSDNTWRLFWAKTDREHPESDWIRPLWAHLLDVAHTALLLWEGFIPNSFRHRIASDLHLSQDDAGRLLSLWVGFHDIGKAIPSFQALHEPSKRRLEVDGDLTFGFNDRLHHGHASISILYIWLQLQNKSGDETKLLEHVSAFVGFHHGRLYPRGNPRRPDLRGWLSDAGNTQLMGDDSWAHSRFELLDAVEEAWFSRYPVSTPSFQPSETLPSWLLGFAGWASLADWLGSMAHCFPRDTGEDQDSYLRESREGAKRALKEVGFDNPASMLDRPFRDFFPFPPRPIQQHLADLPLPDDDTPTLTIVEAPTGEGKTEGAFVLSARQQARQAPGGGLYVAMPSQATSNGLFKRTHDFLQKAHDAARPGVANFRLIHGNSDLHKGQEALANPEKWEAFFDEDNRTDGQAQVATLRWFLDRKRSLLAPYGLGTVDQAFLGILYSRHFFLRLFGLTGKTVLFDEVHAYDLYMSHLFIRLLSWLKELGVNVILLSATLPASLRNACIKAWGGEPIMGTPEQAAYPAIWRIAAGACEVQGNFDTAWSQEAALRRHDPDQGNVATTVAHAVSAGAVVGIICNTVGRAQKLHQAIKHVLPETEVVLFHARFIFDERQRREKLAGARFGKERVYGKPAVLVATQVAEQSLDLDFDVLFTDLAPVDLMLQRAGRLHRHLDRERPVGYEQPVIYWLCPESPDDTLPDVEAVSGGGKVYDRLTIWKTWRLLRNRASWSLPHDYRQLVETVYAQHQEEPVPIELDTDSKDRWREAISESTKERDRARKAAYPRMVVEPDLQGFKKILTINHLELKDAEDASAHPDFRALTREGDSIEVVVFHENADGRLFLDPTLKTHAPLILPHPDAGPSQEAVRALLGNAARISNQSIIRDFQSQSESEFPEAWLKAAKKTPALLFRYPMCFQNRRWTGSAYSIEFNDELGLVIGRR